MKHCPTAWLLYLDKEIHGGAIFDVASMEKFSELKFGEGGTLIFMWTGLGDIHYEFTGTLNAAALAGEVHRVDRRTGDKKYLCDLAAWELPSQIVPSQPENLVSAARYSNMKYSNRGGDLTGVDIRIFSTSEGTKGMMIFYGDSWDEPVFTPLALSKIEMSKGTIHFAAETPNGLAHYRLRLTPAGGLFNRDDIDQPAQKDIPLKKVRPLLPVMGW